MDGPSRVFGFIFISLILCSISLISSVQSCQQLAQIDRNTCRKNTNFYGRGLFILFFFLNFALKFRNVYGFAHVRDMHFIERKHGPDEINSVRHTHTRTSYFIR